MILRLLSSDHRQRRKTRRSSFLLNLASIFNQPGSGTSSSRPSSPCLHAHTSPPSHEKTARTNVIKPSHPPLQPPIAPPHSRPEINPRLRNSIKKMPRPLHNLNTRLHAPRPQRLDRARALLPGDQVVGAAVDQEGRGAVGAG
jgi:hypothetical protein